MKYKKGDKVLLMAEIDGVYEEDDFPYAVNIHVGDNEVIDEYACKDEAIIHIFNTDIAIIPLDANEPCSCYHEVFGHTVCHGTKEMDVCDCGGDQKKCSFYEEVRNKAKKHTFTIAEPSEKGTIITADLYSKTLKDILSMFYIDVLQMMDWSEYEAPLNIAACLKRIIENHTPKEVIDRFEKFQYENTVNVGDVIYLETDKKEYLVTRIIRNDNVIVYHMIAKDSCVTTVTYQNHLNIMPRNAYKKVKSNEDIRSYLYG